MFIVLCRIPTFLLLLLLHLLLFLLLYIIPLNLNSFWPRLSSISSYPACFFSVPFMMTNTFVSAWSSDLDECQTMLHNCHRRANCTNTEGSYVCTCQDLFTGNGTHCEGTNYNLRSRSWSLGQALCYGWNSTICAIDARDDCCNLTASELTHPVLTLYVTAGIRCQHLRPPVNGSLSTNQNLVFDVVSFDCEEGFRSTNNMSIQCLLSGNWSGEVPECKGKLGNYVWCASRAML